MLTRTDKCVAYFVLVCLLACAHHSRCLEPATDQASGSQTWFVRGDGGDRHRCTAKSDAAYSGMGMNQPCAFKHPYYLFTSDKYNDKNWLIKGGDTVILRGGPYRMGYKGPNASDSWGSCPGDPCGCSMPPIPSGTSEHPTRFLGENYLACDRKTQLFGGYAVAAIVNLKGSKGVDIECLELTDHGQCTRVGAGYPASAGCHSNYPLSDYAAAGIFTTAQTSPVMLKSLDIHGLTSRGIIGPVSGNIVADHLRIGFNGGAGWDFDDGKGTKNSPDASVRASHFIIEWNGTNEEYSITQAIPAYNCFDQDHGGYGGAVVTSDASLDFTCNECISRYNTRDGLDLLHLKVSLISIKNSTSYGNMGQQWKMGPMKSVLFQNNVTIHNCRRLSAETPAAMADYRKYLSLFFRSAGDGIAFAVNDGGTYVFQNDSFAGYRAMSYDISCSGACTKSNIKFQNNLHIGYRDPVGGKLPGVFYLSNLPKNPFIARDHSIYFNMRNCPSGSAESCVDPKIANRLPWSGEESLVGIDSHLARGSPARVQSSDASDLIEFCRCIGTTNAEPGGERWHCRVEEKLANKVSEWDIRFL